MTREEAKECWCPYSASRNLPTGEFGNWNTSNCIASACMMWRQRQVPNPEWRQSSGMSYPPQDTRFDPPMYIDDPDHGYCGLAGRP